jgi:hypothetical protein
VAKLIILAVSVLGTLAAACSSALRTSEPAASGLSAQPGVLAPRNESGSSDAARAPVDTGATSVNTSAARSASPSGAAEAAIPSLDRMVIANVSLVLSVDNAVDGARLAERTAERYGGFVAGSNVRDSDSGREASVTLRVPATRLSEALSDLRGIGRKVTDESRTTQDVTEEYTDVDSNIRNLRATETQILALMEKATRVEEILALQRELTSIRGQIERLDGRKRVLENRSDFATIAMKLVEPITAPRSDGWSPLDTATQALAALGRFAERFGTLTIWLLIFIPIYGPVIAAAWWLTRRRRAAATPPPPAAL